MGRLRHLTCLAGFVALATAAACGAAPLVRDDVPPAPRFGVPASSASAPSPAPAPGDAEATEPDPFPVLHTERIGPFEVGMAKEAVVRLAPGLRQQGPVIEEGATAEWVELWADPAEGLSVALSAETEHGPRELRSVEITTPSRLVTRRNVGIGAAYDGVRAEYQDVLDRDYPPTPTTIIAGSLYGGLIFRFEGGVVQSIFLGAGAE